MRIAIIIVGIVVLVVLGLKWDSLSPSPDTFPKEGNIHQLHENKDNEHCKSCKENWKMVDTQTRKNMPAALGL